jgi:hypothetical protein
MKIKCRKTACNVGAWVSGPHSMVYGGKYILDYHVRLDIARRTGAPMRVVEEFGEKIKMQTQYKRYDH